MACPKCGCKVTYQYDDGADLLQDPWPRIARPAARCSTSKTTPPRTMTTMITEPPPPPRSSTGHEWDDDAVCIHCGFDGAEMAPLEAPHMRARPSLKQTRRFAPEGPNPK